ncbi:MAG TPA: helix-turn-helix domain-containing protein [Planctomycetota bacterium]|nr:helix-turn-helix domain-containing protein [Planctomycetota bacterium]
MQTATNEPDLTLEQVAQITQRSLEGIRNLALAGKLPGTYKIGGVWRMRRETLDQIRGISSSATHLNKGQA